MRKAGGSGEPHHPYFFISMNYYEKNVNTPNLPLTGPPKRYIPFVNQQMG